MKMDNVLYVDDDIELLQDRSKFIEQLGYTCFSAKTGSEAMQLISKNHLDVILTDMKVPDYDGFAIIKYAKERDPDVPVIMLTAFASVEAAVHAMKLGAYDFIQKPVSPEMLDIILKKAIEYRKLKYENVVLKAQIKEYHSAKDIVCHSQTMRAVAERICKIAKTDANVFIDGETGTGKELVARLIHSHSLRNHSAFIPLDCVALPTTLLESEIFGFEKGAFTGAIKTKPGILELANGGTLFLDEIAELEPALQAKLLRVLQEREFRRIGGTKTITVNIRIISATNQNPEEAIQHKRLRDDLYYRLNVVSISLPPLRNRIDDIPELVQQFIEEFNPSCPKEIEGIAADALSCLTQYHWPGNVRELKNVIQQAMSLAETQVIAITDLPNHIQKKNRSSEKNSFHNMKYKEARTKFVYQFSKEYFENLFSIYHHNISKIAAVAGVSRKTLYRIIENLGNLQ